MFFVLLGRRTTVINKYFNKPKTYCFAALEIKQHFKIGIYTYFKTKELENGWNAVNLSTGDIVCIEDAQWCEVEEK